MIPPLAANVPVTVTASLSCIVPVPLATSVKFSSVVVVISVVSLPRVNESPVNTPDVLTPHAVPAILVASLASPIVMVSAPVSAKSMF